MADCEITRYDPQAIRIDERFVLRQLGYPQDARVASAVTEALPRTIRAVRDLSEPIALYRLHEVQSASPDEVHLVNGATFRGQRLALALRDARQAAIFALTLGPRVSEAFRELAHRDPFESFLLDGVASILVEAVADRFQAQLEERMNQQGAWGGFRYSPGYCDWPVEENRALVQCVDAPAIGVQLTAGGMMTPQKSISGVIGFGVDPEKMRVNPCPRCPRTECDHRRESSPQDPSDGT